jgi:hypothetical protein
LEEFKGRVERLTAQSKRFESRVDPEDAADLAKAVFDLRLLQEMMAAAHSSSTLTPQEKEKAIDKLAVRLNFPIGSL